MSELVGRRHELDVLVGACSRAAQDRTVTAVVLEGPPGIGKTRLLIETLILQPIETHVQVAGYEPERDLPFAVGRDLIAGLMRSSSGAGDSLAPVLRATSPEDPIDWVAVSEAAHRAVSAGPPLVIVVDDLQCLDDRSTGLLHYLIRAAEAEALTVAFLIAGRSSKAISVLAPSLHKLLADRLTRVVLEPLDESSTMLLARSSNPTLDEATVQRVVVRSRGSPFWCRLLANAGDPEGDVRHIVADALAVLPNDAQEVFSAAVLLARPVHIQEIADILGWTRVQAEDAVARLAVTPLVVQQGETVQVGHEVVREVGERHLPEITRRRTHAAIAQWLDGHANDDVTLLLSAARHYKAAGLDPAPMLGRILRSSTRRFAGRDGLESILELIDGLSPDHPHELALQRDVAALAGELGQHRIALRRWNAIAGRLDDPLEEGRAWLAAGDAAQQLELLEEAHSCLARARAFADADLVLSIELDAANASVTRWLEHRPDEAGRLTTATLERARSAAVSGASSMQEDPRFRSAYLRVLTLACVDAMQRNAPEEILPLTGDIDALAKRSGTNASVEAGLRTGSALMLLGRLREAEDRLDAAWTTARRAFLPDLALDVGSWLVWTRYLRGRLSDAMEAGLECAALVARIGEESRPAKIARVWQTIAQISSGDRDLALEDLRKLANADSDPHHRIIPRGALVKWLARFHGTDASDEIHATLRASAADAETARCERCRSELELTAVEALARIGATQEAFRWPRGTEPLEGDNLLVRWNYLRAEATLAAVADTRDPTLLREAAALADRIGLGLEAIWVRLDLAGALAEADSGAAIALLHEARTRAADAGAASEQQLAERHLRHLGVRTWRRGHRSAEGGELHPLTEREREIARMIADGASNPQIAQALFLSRKTIERHVSNIFAKVDVRNRAELAARVAAAGQDSEPLADPQGKPASQRQAPHPQETTPRRGRSAESHTA
jgi:DNA-binding CsgD family transcriptional regulator